MLSAALLLILAAGIATADTRDYCPAADADRLDAALRADSATAHTPSESNRCIVFISYPSTDASGLRVVRGVGGGLEQAVQAALARMDVRPSTLRLDLVRSAWLEVDQTLDLHAAGRWGIASDIDLQSALPPAEILRRRLIDSDGEFRSDRIARYTINADIEGSEDAWPVRFTTDAWQSQNGHWVELSRGNEAPPVLDVELLHRSARSAAEYLVRAIGHDGRMIYDYRPWLQRSRNSYNILRHAGTTFSLLQAYREFADPTMLAAARRALDHLEQQMRPCPNVPEALCVVERDAIKLGGSGLAIVAIVEYVRATGDRERLGIARKLARRIVAAQRTDGAFRPHKWWYSSGESDSFISGYYPGEAILGLVRLYQEDGNAEWLQTATRGAAYLREVRDADIPDQELAHDHWQLYALADLHKVRHSEPETRHGLRITRVILNAQNRDPQAAGEPQDWRGSFYRPPRSTPTATRAEALLGAWVLAEDDAQFRQEILQSICMAVGFSLQTQFTLNKAYLTGDDQYSVVGGFHRSLTDWGVRIDYVQHNISALLGLAEMLDSAQGKAGCAAVS